MLSCNALSCAMHKGHCTPVKREPFAKITCRGWGSQVMCRISGKPDPYLSLLQAVISRTAKLVAKWQAVGFVHGVLNTDNMSILGETIDYGPFGFLERFDPNFTPNTTDFSGRRYAFRNQPGVGQWNLMALATSFVTEGLCEKVRSLTQFLASRLELL